MRIQHRTVLFSLSVPLLVVAAVLFIVSTSQAGSKWLEQCHGLPVFSGWNAVQTANGSANMVYHFAANCTAQETQLFGYEHNTITIKGVWNRGSKTASETITKIDRYITKGGSKGAYTSTVTFTYTCQNDPWLNHNGNECQKTTCSPPSGLCSIISKYSGHPITYNSVPKYLHLALTTALLGPLEISAPTNGEFITSTSSGYGKVIVKLHGPALFPPKAVGLSLQSYRGINDWEIPFPKPGETVKIPSAAKRVALPNANGIAAIYEVPMTYNTFKLSPTDTLDGKWRIRACAQGLKNTICSRWTVFSVANMLYDKTRGSKFRRLPAKMFRLRHISN